jgi:hypothetical protein
MFRDRDVTAPASARLAAVGAAMLDELRRVFPVCASSDEFHYFPQVPIGPDDLGRWDDYAPATVARTAGRLADWAAELAALAPALTDPEDQRDRTLLARVARTLHGELAVISSWREQPTFYLSIATIGLAQALESGETASFTRRLDTLPDFLARAGANLDHPPALFGELGLEMIEDTAEWLRAAAPRASGLAAALAALTRFGGAVRETAVRAEFRLPADRLDRVVRDHLGCGLDAAGALAEIEAELAEMEERLAREARRFAPGRSWREATELVPLAPLPAEGLIALYEAEVRGLGGHCRELGLIDAERMSSAPVRVEPVPPYLETVRGVGAYSVIAGHPPRGGVFYLLAQPREPSFADGLRRDAGMLAAHETFPGHHLLDLHRWDLARPLRRPLEFPLFYEGWACFAEELMAHTGWFHDRHDAFRQARRHYWRAVRAKIDLSLQTGAFDLGQAAAAFAAVGMDPGHAAAVVRSYPLKPAYQICYTIGRRRFRDLFVRSGLSPAAFAKKVFSAGEVEFEDLERIIAANQ